MRDFISACSSIFVVIGFIVMGIGAVALVMTVSGGMVGEGLLISVAAAMTGASITLVGGGTYLLARIDSRLEELGSMYRQIESKGARNEHGSVVPLLPATGVDAPAGRYRTLDFREVSHDGGPVPAYLPPNDASVVL